jgi:hypothetical protein
VPAPRRLRRRALARARRAARRTGRAAGEARDDPRHRLRPPPDARPRRPRAPAPRRPARHPERADQRRPRDVRRQRRHQRHTSSCFIIGGSFEDYGIAHGTRLLHNRIHGCGRRPATGHDHGIYVEGAVGAVIRGNVIRDNADWGIQLYPYAISSSITGNVITANGGGIIFAGESGRGEYSRGYASSHNRVADNVITGARRLGDVDVYWGGPVGTGNVLEDNCLGGGGRSRRGLKARSNVGADRGSARCRRVLRRG